MLECGNCEKEIDSYPEDRVESGELDEIISHKFSADEDDIAVSETVVYCSPECFVEEHTSNE